MQSSTNNQITIKDAVEWVLKHRKKDAFKNHTAGTIALEISHSISEGLFYYSINEDGNLNGLVCCRWGDDQGTIYVDNILTTGGPLVIKKFMQYYVTTFPNYQIVGHIRERYRFFNDPSKLLRRLK